MTPEQYEAKVVARLERLRARAANKLAEANAMSGRARDMADAIPLGQPLVGSPARMRSQQNYRERINATFQRAHARREEAAKLTRSADVAGRTISSDDPGAVEKLRTKLAEIEAENELHKQINAAWRRGGQAAALAAGFDPKVVQYGARTLELMPSLRVPFPPGNGAANARRVRERIALLEQAAAEPARPSETYGDVVLSENRDVNRVQLRFATRPSSEVVGQLRSGGFKWSPSEGAWQRQTGCGAWARAQQIASQFGEKVVSS